MAVGNRRRSHVQLKYNDENIYQLVINTTIMPVNDFHVFCKACLALSGITNMHRFFVVDAQRAHHCRLLAGIALVVSTMCG